MTDQPRSNAVPELEETCCPLCGGSDTPVHLTTQDYLFHVPGTYSICRCHDCRHFFLNPRPTLESLASCYPENYGPHQNAAKPLPDSNSGSVSAAEPAATPWYLRYLPLRHIPFLKPLYYWLTDDRGQPLPKLPSLSGPSVPKALELGCATGSYLSKLTAAGWDACGIEPGVEASEKARAAGFKVTTGTLDDVALSPESVDAVAAWMVLEHVVDPMQTLGQMHDALAPGGQLLMSAPNAGSWERMFFGSSWYAWEPPRHLHHFSPLRIRRILQRVGFVNVRIVHQPNVLNLIASLGIALSRIGVLRGIGERLIRYPESPNMWIQLLLSPLAHVLALLRQSGRLTIFAERSGAVQRSRAQEESP